jgi:hypothetical protein
MNDPYLQYYIRQAQGVQYGGHYTGSGQKGAGIGSFFGGLFRRIIPLFSSSAKAVGNEALATGVNLLRDVITGKSFKESVGERVNEAGQNLSRRASTKLQSMVGSGRIKKSKRKKSSHSSSGAKKKRKVVRTKKRKTKKKSNTRYLDIFT